MIRIFVGCAPNHEDAESQAVLEYSLRLHASEPIEITWMKLSSDPSSPFYSKPPLGWNTSNWPTPFSGFRWAVPALCNFEGRAIYMDSDVIVMADIAELWHMPINGWKGVKAKAKNRLCVSLWDCAHQDVRRELDFVRTDSNVHYSVETDPFPHNENWNCLDGENYPSVYDPRIKALHYSSMPHQPHLKHARKRLEGRGKSHWFDGKVTNHWRDDVQELFDNHLKDAAAAGFGVEAYCAEPAFGGYQKGSVAALQGAIPSWGRATK